MNAEVFVEGKRYFKIKPHKIARAIIGHLFAGCISDDLASPPMFAPVPDALRNYFQNKEAGFPENIDIYFWLYPSTIQVIVQYFAYSDIRSRGCITASLIKFFPLAFLVVWDKPASVQINHSLLFSQKNCGLDECFDIEGCSLYYVGNLKSSFPPIK